MSRESNAMNWGLLVLAGLIWGGMFPVAKVVLHGGVDAVTTTAIRYGVGSLILLAILVVFEGRDALATEGRGRRLFTYGTVGFAGFNILAYIGLAHSRAEHAAVIMALQPMIAVLMSWLRNGRRPSGFTLASVAVAFLGVFLVVTNGHPEQAWQDGAALGDLMLLVAAFCWVTYTLGAADFPHWSPLRYTAVSGGLGTVSILAILSLSVVFGAIHPPAFATVAGLGWELAYLIVLGAVVAVLSWNSGIKAVGPVNGVLFINLVPVVAFLIGVAQGHAFGRAEVLGAVLVVGALIANNLYGRRRIVLTAARREAGLCEEV